MPILGNVIPPSNALTPTTVTATGKVTAGAKLDMNGTEIILDADADTSITADTDDQIDIRIAGADDFRFTADTFSVLSGSTLNVDSGATIANSGTATGFGPSVAAAAGIMEANATFVDAVIFGPALDPVDWSGRTAASTASLMLATVEDTGSDTQVNIWDLTSTTIANATPLATLTITGANLPKAIAASMGYVYVAHDDGLTVFSPHDNDVWAEMTDGWPRSLTSITAPALATSDTPKDIAAGIVDPSPLDTRTGGPIPTGVIAYAGGNQAFSIIKADGNVWDRAGTGNTAAISNNRAFVNLGNTLYMTGDINSITADTPQLAVVSADGNTDQAGVDANTAGATSVVGSTLAIGSTGGFTLSKINKHGKAGEGHNSLNSKVTRVYNTGMIPKNNKGVWLANSKTADRGPKGNTLTENGTVTEAAVETSAELMGYSGWSTSNYFSRAYDVDFNGIQGIAVWVRIPASPNTTEFVFNRRDGTSGARYFNLHIGGTGTYFQYTWNGVGGAGYNANASYAFPRSTWMFVVCVNDVPNDINHLYIDGVLVNTVTGNAASDFEDTDAILQVGLAGSANPLKSDTKLALLRFSATAPTATQVRQMYDAEKGMFVASAKCLLQSGSTDAVLDVSVDPITSKVAVTQTDSQMIWNGLVMESAPAVNTGASEHNLLFGGDRVEINAVNLYATIAAKSLRGDLDLVRGLKAGLSTGPDLGKCKAWCYIDSSGGINASYNIKSVTDNGVGDFTFAFGVPFKGKAGQSAAYSAFAFAEARSAYDEGAFLQSDGSDTTKIRMVNKNDAATGIDSLNFFMGVFGELDNE